MTQIRSLAQPVHRRPGELGVHSLDLFNFLVPDAAAAEKFYRSFGLDVREEQGKLNIYTQGHPHRWGSLVEGPRKKLNFISFGAFEKLLSSVRIARAGLVRHLARISSPSFFIVMAMLYLLLPANIAMPYFTLFPDFVPSSMGQNTVPSYDMNSVVQSLNWIASHSGQGTALITHQAIYGWARAFFPFRSEIVNYQFANPQSGASQALSLGYSRIYAIWWVQGSGWYNYPSMGSGFVPVHVEGDIAVYLYTT